MLRTRDPENDRLCAFEPWHRQCDIMRAVEAHDRVTIRSGHKCGKTTCLAGIALWFACTRPQARVIFTAASYRQVKGILFREIATLHKRSRWPLGGELHANPESGIQFRDGREIIGFSTDDPERFAGFSGANLLFIVDEASGVADKIFEAIEGNRAGNAKLVLISNPTQLSGAFYRSHTQDARLWHPIHISSEEAAQVQPHPPGLATESWIAEKREEWGVEDSRYQVRVLGNFPRQGDDAMIPLRLVEEAIARHPSTAAVGPLSLGIDVARYGNDSSVIAPARGKKVLPVTALKGADVVEVAGKALEIARELRRGEERVTVKIDTSNMGGGVADILRRSADWIDVVECMASSQATAQGYSRLRDQIWGGLRDWLKELGALPDEPKLRDDVIAPTYGFDAQARIKVESKLEMRSRIGRSTDYADAVALAVFQVAVTEWDPIVARLSSRG